MRCAAEGTKVTEFGSQITDAAFKHPSRVFVSANYGSRCSNQFFSFRTQATYRVVVSDSCLDISISVLDVAIEGWLRA
jgi:hypothetical protein